MHDWIKTIVHQFMNHVDVAFHLFFPSSDVAFRSFIYSFAYMRTVHNKRVSINCVGKDLGK